nr:MAK10-like protein [Tanacetum cinerariifolium]
MDEGRAWLASRLKMWNGKTSHASNVCIPLTYQLMAVKKTSFPEMECSGSVVEQKDWRFQPSGDIRLRPEENNPSSQRLKSNGIEVEVSFSSTIMGDANPNRTLRDYSKPSHEGYRNTIELLERNNMVTLQSDTIWLVQNGCSFHGHRSEDPNQHLKEFSKLVDSLDLDGANRERTNLCYFNFPFTIKLAIDLNIFQQDPSPHGRILLLVSLLNFFHREGPQNFSTIS